MDNPILAKATISAYGMSFSGDLDIPCEDILLRHPRDVHTWHQSDFLNIALACASFVLNVQSDPELAVNARPIVVTIDYTEEVNDAAFEKFIINAVGSGIDVRSIDFVTHTVAINIGLKTMSDNTLTSVINRSLSRFADKYEGNKTIPETITIR